MARFPVEQADDDLVADAGGPSGVARRADVNVVGDARIIGDDEKKVLALAKGADQLGPFTFQDADDGAVDGTSAGRRAPAGTSRRTRTRLPCMAVEVALSSITISWRAGSSGWRKPRPWRVMRRTPGTRSAWLARM